ncbi:hypothetical protein [Microcoleus sp.]|uniref:hypothetical protein n=1 Tax=Microcoleus sp. TaxID=44472 RepID=UPI003593841C
MRSLLLQHLQKPDRLIWSIALLLQGMLITCRATLSAFVALLSGKSCAEQISVCGDRKCDRKHYAQDDSKK